MVPCLRPLARTTTTLLATTLLTLSGCDGGGTDVPPPVAEVRIVAPADSVAYDGTLALGAVLLDVDGDTLEDRTVTWTSRDPDVAEVDAAGQVRGKALGEVWIRADAAQGVADSVRLRVTSPLQWLAIRRDWGMWHSSLAVGRTDTLVALGQVSGGGVASQQASWSSSDPSVLSVGADGAVHGVAPGTATVRVEAQGRRDSVRVVVARGYEAVALPFAGTPTGLGDAGHVVGWLESQGSRRAFVWKDGALTTIPGPGSESVARAVNAQGQVVGTYTGSDGVVRPFLWDDGTFVELAPDATVPTYATAISGGGTIVGFREHSALDAEALLWKDGALSELGRLGFAGAWPQDVNDAGDVVGRFQAAGAGTGAFLLRDGAVTQLAAGLMDGAANGAWAVSTAGTVVGDGRSGFGHANAGGGFGYAWREGAVVESFGLPRHYLAHVRDVSPDGMLAVGTQSSSVEPRQRAFAWPVGQDTGPLSLEGLVLSPGLSLTDAVAVNAGGTILATRTTADGQGTETVLLVPQP